MADIVTLARPTDPGTAAIDLAAALAKVSADDIRGQGRGEKLVRLREAVALVVQMLSAGADVATPLGRSAGWVQAALQRASDRYINEEPFKEFVDVLAHALQALWLQGRLLMPQAPLPIEHWLDLERILQSETDHRAALAREIARAHAPAQGESFALWLAWTQFQRDLRRTDIARLFDCKEAEVHKAWLRINSRRHADPDLDQRCQASLDAYDTALTRVPLLKRA
ncbi:MAG: hypothetical protein EAZ99_05665 [Alphaproteobacteria bacterium]|nr:hypothetical protein [Alphaproteobacteria bacterium]TAD90538.1 MAG: hypothetical protein EAZ99_05665 [Alphaproteobacteria bacterium]